MRSTSEFLGRVQPERQRSGTALPPYFPLRGLARKEPPPPPFPPPLQRYNYVAALRSHIPSLQTPTTTAPAPFHSAPLIPRAPTPPPRFEALQEPAPTDPVLAPRSDGASLESNRCCLNKTPPPQTPPPPPRTPRAICLSRHRASTPRFPSNKHVHPLALPPPSSALCLFLLRLPRLAPFYATSPRSPQKVSVRSHP